MHGTSDYRQRAAQLMAKLVQESGASGLAFGWTDALNPGLLAPVHVVSAAPVRLWQLRRVGLVTEAARRRDPLRWRLVLRGVDEERLQRLRPSVEFLKGFLEDATHDHVPLISPEAPGFVQLLDAYRFCGFHLDKTHRRPIRFAFHETINELPGGAQEAASAVVDALRDHGRLQTALLELGSALDIHGWFRAGADVHLVGYELALHRCHGGAGIDAARSAGRAFRRAADLSASLRWYELAARLAEFEEAWGRLALALDGAGNTHRHRGAYPRARVMYERAWQIATVSEDPTAIGNVAHSMMTVSREAGDLEAAARFGWTSLAQRKDPSTRANLLLNLGTLLREGGDVENSEKAFRIAHRDTSDPGVRAMAADALAYSAALRGDEETYSAWRAQAREQRIGEPFLRAQMGYFRGKSLAALGERRHAKRAMAAVARYAKRHGLTEWEVKAAETELPPPQSPPMKTPDEVQQGLHRLETVPA